MRLQARREQITCVRLYSTFFGVHGKEKQTGSEKQVCCMLINYAPNAYRLWDREKKKLFLARDDKFDESIFPFATEMCDETPLVIASYELKDQDVKCVQPPE